MIKPCSVFLSTPSARRATQFWDEIGERLPISIHALREEGDRVKPGTRFTAAEFLSTPSARRATKAHSPKPRLTPFLSTPSARRATPKPTRNDMHPTIFLSTPSARRATALEIAYTQGKGISIHALREEGDKEIYAQGNTADISIHALREEGDISTSFQQTFQQYFYPRPPRGGRQQKQRQNLYFLINYTTFCTNLEEP